MFYTEAMRYILPLLLALPLLLGGCTEPSDFLTGSSPRPQEATGSPAPASASSAAVSASPQKVSATTTPSPSASGSITPPANLDTALEAAFSKCAAEYQDSLRGRQVLDDAVTRVTPYETIVDQPNRRIEYREIVRSNFIHIANGTGGSLEGKYVRELTRCSVDYDEKTKQLKPHSEISIEETTRPVF